MIQSMDRRRHSAMSNAILFSSSAIFCNRVTRPTCLCVYVCSLLYAWFPRTMRLEQTFLSSDAEGQSRFLFYSRGRLRGYSRWDSSSYEASNFIDKTSNIGQVFQGHAQFFSSIESYFKWYTRDLISTWSECIERLVKRLSCIIRLLESISLRLITWILPLHSHTTAIRHLPRVAREKSSFSFYQSHA